MISHITWGLGVFAAVCGDGGWEVGDDLGKELDALYALPEEDRKTKGDAILARARALRIEADPTPSFRPDVDFSATIFTNELLDALDRIFLKHFPSNGTWHFGTTHKETHLRMWRYYRDVKAFALVNFPGAQNVHIPVDSLLHKVLCSLSSKLEAFLAPLASFPISTPLMTKSYLEALAKQLLAVDEAYREVSSALNFRLKFASADECPRSFVGSNQLLLSTGNGARPVLTWSASATPAKP